MRLPISSDPFALPGRGAQLDAHRLVRRAAATLDLTGSLLDRADTRAPVSARSRALCASLGVLAEDAYVALGGRSRRSDVGHAAALLSLLTKVDDEVIDAAAFHGGPARQRGHTAVRRRTRAYLAPTLDSLLRGRPASSDPRCELAAEVGVRLQALAADGQRLVQLHRAIAAGWEVQVRAVDLLSRHPAHTTLLQIARLTAEISGYWLMMITMVGGLPSETRRPLSPAEQRVFLRWGWHIQRADALADFGKDVDAGLANSWAGRVLYERAGEPYVRALVDRRHDALYGMLRVTGSDAACRPRHGSTFVAPSTGLGALGAVPQWLRWIHTMLLGRYDQRESVGSTATEVA